MAASCALRDHERLRQLSTRSHPGPQLAFGPSAFALNTRHFNRFCSGLDPVRQGFVKNLTRPGGNVTGFAAFEFSVGGNWVELLKELSPKVDRIGILYNPATTPFEQYVVHGKAAADALGIR